ncbi:family 43 glycosylhydrolase [Metabacillus arenae]|uniref:Family 43 glycosylhydrolase n=1 Tax=Metabacillus arenae TaxID=2771434 RepID=A0A926NMD0_9BACI|nr:family 43 glycosylhydrolase [Metabacillus arenae]MBD1383355.1 family 43 glycosylhydrolase [Metabacillus arenae]
MSQKTGNTFRGLFFIPILLLFFSSTLNAENLNGKSDRTASTSTFKNPINTAGADPYVMYHSDGYYYFTRTLGHRIDIWKSRTLTGIDLGERKTVWTKPSNVKDIWAPEIHHINGKWYIYYTANTGCGDDCRGVYVLENASADPLSGEWVEKGKVNTEYAGLDGSVFNHKGKLYFMYAAYGDWSGEHGSAIAIAPMSNPWTLNGKNVILTYPEYEWEKKGMHVNEGAVILKRGDKIHLVYSASACWEDDYAISKLTASDKSNLLDPKSWSKSKEPLFSKSEENSVYGPGHNSFVKSKDGKEDWIVYHGNSAPGQGCGPRPTRVQNFSWNNDDSPNFGVPISDQSKVPSGEYQFEAEHGKVYKAKLKGNKKASNKKTVTLNNRNSNLLMEDINVPEAGTYIMIVKYSNSSKQNAIGYVSVNGKSPSKVKFPSTKREKFDTVTVKVDLKKGYNNKIEFRKGKHAIEIDYISISGDVTFSIKSGSEYKLINPNGGKALSVENHSTNDANVLTRDKTNDNLLQSWKIVDLGQGYYKLINPSNGKALSLDSDPTMPGTNVNIQDWSNLDSQKWEIVDNGAGYYKLINMETNKALDVGGASIDSGANVGTWEDIPSGPAQMWLLYKLD